jgi:ubiquinone/menaquinone biosynthesis C-methylase UbiE
MSLRKHRQDWEELSGMDPYWAVLSDDRYKCGKWDPTEFFRIGDDVIRQVLGVAERLGYPRHRERALDFGCGVGRLTRALAQHFDQCSGVDISANMIARAREFNQEIPNCEFIHNDAEDLRLFADDQFDMVFTTIVLQHIPGEARIKSYVADFVRILKPDGLLVFQLPSHIPPRLRIQLRRRVYGLLRHVGVHQRYLHERFSLNPIRMSAIPEAEITSFLDALGAKVLHVEADSNCGPRVQSRTYYATKLRPTAA